MSDIIFEFTDGNSWEFLSEESNIIFEIEHLTESITGNSIGTINGDDGSVEVGSIGDTISIIGTTDEIEFTGSDKTLTASLPNAGHWDSAYGWGDHANAGYLTSYNETDPVFVAHDAYDVTSVLIGQWNEAYGWGDHANAGYLTSYNETDPVFVAHVAYAITATLIGYWNSAYNHIHNLTSDINHNGLANYEASEHIDWTASQAPTVIHANNYTDTDTHLSESDITTMGFTKDVEIDWTQSQSPAVIHADNYTDTNTLYESGDFSHDSLSGVTANEHIDWTASQAPTVIHADNYTDTNTQLVEADITGFGFTKDVEVDWSASQAPTIIHADNYTDTGDTTAHASFSQLGYAEAGHTGFEPAKGDDDNYVTDAMFASLGNISEWDSAYGWGDHASAGYVDTANSPEANDIARFTDGNTIEGRSYSEFKKDLDLEAGTDFYSKSAEDTWRDSVSQTEMGYLHGVTADIQTQINDLERLIYHLAL